jgi:hypothetical protein
MYDVKKDDETNGEKEKKFTAAQAVITNGFVHLFRNHANPLIVLKI